MVTAMKLVDRLLDLSLRIEDLEVLYELESRTYIYKTSVVGH